MAVGRASYSVNTAYACAAALEQRGTETFFLPNSTGQNNALLWGYTVGAGLDWALTPNILVRGEFEFVQFAPISSIAVSVATGRVGAGFKF